MTLNATAIFYVLHFIMELNPLLSFPLDSVTLIFSFLSTKLLKPIWEGDISPGSRYFLVSLAVWYWNSAQFRFIPDSPVHDFSMRLKIFLKGFVGVYQSTTAVLCKTIGPLLNNTIKLSHIQCVCVSCVSSDITI